MARFPFPNERLNLGSDSRFVRDLQRSLRIAETGVFDFLTMCRVVVHKFENGLNHNDPTVDEETWNDIFNKDNNNNGGEQTEPGNRPAAAGDREGVATVGQLPRTGTNETANPEDGNTRATTTGTTNATDENIPTVANPETNPDAPREDMPTTTAEEQRAAGEPAGGFASVPTGTVSNSPDPGAAAAGVESADNQAQENNPTPAPTTDNSPENTAGENA